MRARRWSMALALAALLLTTWRDASGYTHFVRYLTRNAPFEAVLTRFDLRSLPGKQVPYFIERRGPDQLAEGDSLTALFSQIQSAAEVWNTVPTSELRVVFGGLIEPGTPMSGPHIEIVFDEVPPGLVALGGPEMLGEMTEKDGTVFVPIVKSVLVLPANLAEPARPSWSERLYQTIVHEFGHTLGLQHSWASSTMSTEITRATTKATPLSADDIAGISVLYPTAEFREKWGSIAGRVVMNGQGVHLASVVALKPTGEAVSALTAPDGTYVIKGLTPGSYYVYAHPLPPGLAGEPQPVNLDLPLGPDGPMMPGGAFDLAFYPWGSAPEVTVEVKEGERTDDIGFWVQPRTRVNLHSVQTYRFFGQTAVKPAFFQPGEERGSIVLYGYGMSTAFGPVAGLTGSLLQAPEALFAPGLFAYATAPSYLQADVAVPAEAPTGPRHMIFRLGTETHVAPGAYRVAQAAPPQIESLEAGEAEGTLVVRGQRLDRTARVVFDGAAAEIKEKEAGHLVVKAPRAANGHVARVSVLDGEGQSSAMLDGGTAHVHRYDNGPPPSLRFEPAHLPAGVETILEVSVEGSDWTPVKLGFGNSDVSVGAIWKTGPGKALAQVRVAAEALPTSLTAVAAGGLILVEAPHALSVAQAGSAQAHVQMSAIENRAYSPGDTVVLPLINLRSLLNPATTSVQIGGVAAPVIEAAAGLVKVQIPAGVPAGPARVLVSMPGEQILPAALLIGAPPQHPPVVTAAQSVLALNFSAFSPARPGELIQLRVSGLPDEVTVERLQVVSAGVLHEIDSIRRTIEGHILYVQLSLHSPRGPSVPLVVRHGALESAPFLIPVW